MTTPIIVYITPDPDGVRCGECRGMSDSDYGACVCNFSVGSILDGWKRGPRCFAVEKLFADLREAGEAYDETSTDGHRMKRWASALAAIDKAKP